MNIAQAQALGFATILGAAAGSRRAPAPAFGQNAAPLAPSPPPAPASNGGTGSLLPWWGWMIAGAGALAVGYVGARYASKKLGGVFGGRDEAPASAADELAEYARDPRGRGIAHVPRRPPPPLDPARSARSLPRHPEHDADANVDDGYREMYDFNREED